MLTPRQFPVYGVGVGESDTDYIVRWAIVGSIIIGGALFLTLAYTHARHRQNLGLAPLRYHSRRNRRQG